MNLSTADREAVERAVDVAIDEDQLVILRSATLAVLVANDLAVLQGIANGEPQPRTMRIRRPDGRSAYVFQLPTELRTDAA